MTANPKPRKKSSLSPTQRSLAHLRKEGWTVAVVERWNAWARIRQDLFGILDLVALDGKSILGVQVSSTANLSSRRKKILASQAAKRWVLAGGRIVLHGWSKRGPRGKRKLWALTVYEISLDDLVPLPEPLF